MELTMPVKKQDDRGNRRTFTIASSPTERAVHVGVRVPPQPSRFKQVLSEMKTGSSVQAGQVAGSFMMPSDPTEKLLFIAGGVGITPFRSMVKYLSDKQEKRDIVLVYLTKSKSEYMFRQLFDAAQEIGVKTIYVASTEPLQKSELEMHVPDLLQRKAYISGPPRMLRHIKRILTSLGVPKRSIKTDYFSGY
jgi:ferredoxin-NADP reductase